MTLERIIYMIPYLISATITIGIGMYAFLRPAFPGARSLGWLALLEAEWTLTFIGQTLSPTLEGKLFWNNAQFFGAIFSPMAYFAFALEYTHRRIPNPRLTWKIVTTIPAFILLVVWTDQLHGLWRVAPQLAAGFPFDQLVFRDGPMFVLYPLFGYTTLVFATLLLMVNFFATPRIYRFQIGTVLAGIAFPWVVTLIAVLRILPWQVHEATPIAFAFSNAIVAWALFRFGLFNIVPVARELLVENLHDAVIVLDSAARIVDFNRATQRLLDRPAPNVIGKELAGEWPALYEQVKDLGDHSAQQNEISLIAEGQERCFELSVAPLGGRPGSKPGKLITMRDISDQKRIEAELQKLAITDPLTGLYNRRQFFELAEHELERAHRYHHPMSMIMLDLDDFKRTNDHYGHRIGDQVLQTIATTLNRRLRENDIIARYGGEEFTVLLPETDAARAYEAAERLRISAGLCSIATERGLVQVTLSMGVVCLLPGDNLDIDQMLERADQALYTAKHAGRDQVCMWAEGQDAFEVNG